MNILSKVCFKEIFEYPPFECTDRGFGQSQSPKQGNDLYRKPQCYRVQSASSICCVSDWSKLLQIDFITNNVRRSLKYDINIANILTLRIAKRKIKMS